MSSIFLKRVFFTKTKRGLIRHFLSLSTPFINENTKNKYTKSACEVIFDGIEKYNAVIEGVDDIHSIECAIAYVNSICRNSEDPEFFHEDGESMRFIDERLN